MGSKVNVQTKNVHLGNLDSKWLLRVAINSPTLICATNTMLTNRTPWSIWQARCKDLSESIKTTSPTNLNVTLMLIIRPPKDPLYCLKYMVAKLFSRLPT
ncbi:hypothetical protein O6H91_18G022600 [Diphasiastrum complanatum]|uniref:Uncharacterized protein n=1 Tax=Diphasiastrum complanatum TaxID=34168 RepID=A0ACC2AYT1_DIPCM|nr:hypothetical protein O6H91_18G022600 [Diphasiastrum complanatum]